MSTLSLVRISHWPLSLHPPSLFLCIPLRFGIVPPASDATENADYEFYLYLARLGLRFGEWCFFTSRLASGIRNCLIFPWPGESLPTPWIIWKSVFFLQAPIIVFSFAKILICALHYRCAHPYNQVSRVPDMSPHLGNGVHGEWLSLFGTTGLSKLALVSYNHCIAIRDWSPSFAPVKIWW